MEKLNIEDLAQALGGIAYQVVDPVIFPQGVSIDTREALTGRIFIPMKGTRDGHDFLSVAVEKGAILAITEKPVAMPHILVPSTTEAIKTFAKYYKGFFQIPTVGITGSVGKTTTKDLTASVIAQKYRTLKTQGNFNNEIGLPLTVFNLEAQTQVAVLEMGMNHLLEIHNLVDIARPTIALITNIGEAHIENLGSRAGILKAKSEILDFNPETVILNGDDPLLLTLHKRVPHAKYYYLNKPEAQYTAYNITHHGLQGTTATLKVGNEVFDVNIPIPGDYMVQNALAAAMVGQVLGLSVAQIKAGIETFTPSKNRMDIIQIGNISLINDVYNASPQSVKTMLDLIAEQTNTRKVAILGDMFELGDFSQAMHHEVGGYEKMKALDTLISIGKWAKHIHEAGTHHTRSQYYETKADFLKALPQWVEIWQQEKTLVLVKASRGMGFEDLVEALVLKENT